MKWTFRLRGKDVTLTSVQSAVAVRPSDEARSRAASRPRLVRQFGGAVRDTSAGGRFGLDLPARNRQLFERAGWLFVEPKPEVEGAAAITRATVADAAAVQQVFVDGSGNVQITTDLLTVKLDPEMPESEVKQRLKGDGLSVVRQLRFTPNTYEVRALNRRPLPELLQAVQDKPHYLFAEPMLLQAITGRFRPTDPDFGRQWQHSNDGSNGGTAGADIRAEQAWELTRGRGPDRPVRIAVIDNGMQVRHPDLKAGVVAGGSFQSGGFGSSTFVKYKPGATGFPDEAHGTFCMGMAGARMNNKRGGCGAAPESDLIAVACLDDQVGTQTTLARAVAFAADPTREDSTSTAAAGADVIACSLGPNGADWELTSILDIAIRFAANQGRGGLGTPIFWAASNGHFQIERDEVSSHPDVIAVGRSDHNDQADGSAFGPKLEFLAPGVDVYNTTSGSKYRFWTGTSFAAPLAAGVGALVLARNPQWTGQQVRERLRETCDKVGGVTYNSQGHHNEYGHGRVNAARAVQ
ncbi:MAG TPA: S8 family serine peptidase [Pyrinomonadaceae bacterium]